MDELVKIEHYNKRRLNIILEESDTEVIILFEDNAGGIKDEIIDELFEPYKSTKESSGLGVGLNIAKKIIESNNGEIKSYNKNNGAVFKICFARVVYDINTELNK